MFGGEKKKGKREEEDEPRTQMVLRRMMYAVG